MSSSDAWVELGLKATADALAVRRAYAVRLKGVDPDRDPAGFIRLREAYEAALRWTAAGTPPRTPPPREPPREAPPEADWGAVIMPPLKVARPPPPPPDLHDSAEDGRAFAVRFDAALADGRLAPLMAVHRQGLAAGLIPLGDEAWRLAEVLEVAAEDRSASLDDLQRLDREHPAPARPGPDAAAREAFAARLEAEAWFDARVRERKGWIPLVGPAKARIARVVIGPDLPWRIRPADVAPVREQLVEMRRHGGRLTGRIEAGRADQVEHWIDRQLKPTLRDMLSEYAMVIGALMVIAFAAKLLGWR